MAKKKKHKKEVKEPVQTEEDFEKEYHTAEDEFEKILQKQSRIRPKIFLENGRLLAKDNDSISVLVEGFYGKLEKGVLILNPIEAMYLTNIRNIPCMKDENKMGLVEISATFANEARIITKYNIFRDWRDRGLILDFPERMGKLEDFGRSPMLKYPSRKTEFPCSECELLYFPQDMISIANYSDQLKNYFEDMWFGQLGVYKQHHRDKILKLDFVETIFLAKKGFAVRNSSTGEIISAEELMRMVKERRPDAEALYDVYEDWRNRGYVLKTGFKFGTHFRLYFPGASPLRGKEEWMHSKHVIHVFPKDARLIMSEWARAVRVAHSVRKTFIMAIPGMTDKDYQTDRELLDFIGYHRKKTGIEKPSEDKPKFAIVSFAEDEEFGGNEMAASLARADEYGLRLIIAITDRETAVTYYVAKRINLPGSRNKYYEIEWEQP